MYDDRRYNGLSQNGYDRYNYRKDYEPKAYEAPVYEPKTYEPAKEPDKKDYEPKDYAPKEYVKKDDKKDWDKKYCEPKDCEPKECDKKDDKKEDEKEFHCKECEFIEGNSVAFELKKDDCEIRADILVKKSHCVRVWGRVKSCYDEPIEGALVKLVKIVYWKGRYQFVGLAHTVTDCKGFYQFDICEKDEHCEYRVIVGKAATGKERTLGGYGSCRPCECEDKPKMPQ